MAACATLAATPSEQYLQQSEERQDARTVDNEQFICTRSVSMKSCPRETSMEEEVMNPVYCSSQGLGEQSRGSAGLFSQRASRASEPSWADRLVIPKNHPVQFIWNCILFVLLIYMATVFLYRFAFCVFHIGPDGITPIDDTSDFWAAVQLTIDVLFWFDLFLTFFLAYEDNRGHEVKSLSRITKKYIKCMFWVNLLACLPEKVVKEIIEVIARPEDGGSQIQDFGIARLSRLQRMSRLARLVRLTRLVKLADVTSRSSSWDWFKGLRGVRIINFMVGLVWACHLLACGWYLVAALHVDVTTTWVGRRMVTVDGEERSLLCQPPEEQWLVAMYFVLTVFTTVGFGDISAGTDVEILYVVLTMVVGAVVHSIIISEVIQVVTSTDKIQEFIDSQVSLVHAFSNHTDLDPQVVKELSDQIVGHIKTATQSRAQVLDKEKLKSLILGKLISGSLLGTVSVSLYRGKLCKNAFLKNCAAVSFVPPRLPSLLALHLVQAEFKPGEIVFQMHDFAFNLFLVLSGTFAFMGIPGPEGGIDSMVSDWVAAAASVHDDNPSRNNSGSRQSTSPKARRQSISPPGEKKAGRKSFLASAMGDTSIMFTPKETRSQSPKNSEMKQTKLWPYMLIGHSNYFGEFECISGCGKAREATVRCEQAGTVLVLRKMDFFELVEEFPQFGDFWAAAAFRRETQRRHALRRLKVKMSFHIMAAVIVQRAWRRSRDDLDTTPTRNGARYHGIRSSAFAELLDKTWQPRAAKYARRKTVQSQESSQVSRQIQELQRTVYELHKDIKDLRSDLTMSI